MRPSRRACEDSGVSTIVLLPVSVMIVLAGALLFTNAIEWLGAKLELAQGAVGSLLAAVATALPESLIPITAIVRGGEGSDEVATGALLRSRVPARRRRRVTVAPDHRRCRTRTRVLG